MLDAQQIKDMDAVTLIESAAEIYDIEEPLRAQIRALFEVRAKDVGVEKSICAMLKAFDKTQKKLAREYTDKYSHKPGVASIDIDGRGMPIKSIENFLRIMRFEPYYESVKYNLLTYSPEYRDAEGVIRKWDDADDNKSKHFIEANYNIYDRAKHEEAFSILCEERTYHPVKDYIERIDWDGVPRIRRFLTEWCKADDTPYTEEVSRLIFAGGINRLYHPGCKFDDVAVLIGTQQGEGKSTIVRWLAMRDEFFSEITTIEGKDGMENLAGSWICEVSELMAVTKAKEQEAVKSYITRSIDHYRQSYGRRAKDYPRQCMFIGTTNKQQFLSDKTGNRRWYPVTVHSNGYDLYRKEKEAREYIKQCWAEAYAKLDTAEMRPCADGALSEVYKRVQRESMQDDYREGLITAYLEDKTKTCVLDLWYNALGYSVFDKPTRKDSDEISLILQSMPYWVKTGPGRFGGVDSRKQYGVQRIWEKRLPEQVKM